MANLNTPKTFSAGRGFKPIMLVFMIFCLVAGIILVLATAEKTEVARAMASDGSLVILQSFLSGTIFRYDPRLPRDHLIRLLPVSWAKDIELYGQKDTVVISEPSKTLFCVFHTKTPDFQYCTIHTSGGWSAESDRDSSHVWMTVYGTFDIVHKFTGVPEDGTTLEVHLYRTNYKSPGATPDVRFLIPLPLLKDFSSNLL